MNNSKHVLHDNDIEYDQYENTPTISMMSTMLIQNSTTFIKPIYGSI